MSLSFEESEFSERTAPERKTITVRAVWLRNIGDYIEVWCEVLEGTDWNWRRAIREFFPSQEVMTSHIAEANGISGWPLDEPQKEEADV
ncbi:MAG: hypothetical protein ACRD2L_16230 [Terriglobia bacterium]